MKVGETFDTPESSFLIIEKDHEKVINKLLSNPRLLKLLYYREQDALKKPSLTAEQKLKLIGKEIRIIPKLDIDKDCPIFVVITFDNFTPNAKNP